jgi:hypothetical protein
LRSQEINALPPAQRVAHTVFQLLAGSGAGHFFTQKLQQKIHTLVRVVRLCQLPPLLQLQVKRSPNQIGKAIHPCLDLIDSLDQFAGVLSRSLDQFSEQLPT